MRWHGITGLTYTAVGLAALVYAITGSPRQAAAVAGGVLLGAGIGVLLKWAVER